MMQDNFTNQISLQEEESIDIKKEARLLPVFLALFYCCRVSIAWYLLFCI